MKRKKDKFVPSTMEDRINYLRETILSVIVTHGAPCGCTLCEALIFDCLAGEGKINLETGKRKNEQ